MKSPFQRLSEAVVEASKAGLISDVLAADIMYEAATRSQEQTTDYGPNVVSMVDYLRRKLGEEAGL